MNHLRFGAVRFYRAAADISQAHTGRQLLFFPDAAVCYRLRFIGLFPCVAMSLQAQTVEAAAPRIVKAHAVETLGTPVTFNYEDLRRACDEHIAAVRVQSRRIIEETGAEADRLRRESAESGRRDGYRDGLKAAEADIAARVERLAAERLGQQLKTVLPATRQLADGLRLERDRWVSRWEGEAVRLAVAIAERLLRRTLAADPAAADRLIAEVLRMASGSPRLTVRLSPADHERLGGSLGTVADMVGCLSESEVVADPTVGPGGCVIETRHGRIDGRVETLLDRIASELTGATCPSEETTDPKLSSVSTSMNPAPAPAPAEQSPIPPQP